jgi:hypothetical protein
MFINFLASKRRNTREIIPAADIFQRNAGASVLLTVVRDILKGMSEKPL